ELDAVVIEGVVRGTDHHTTVVVIGAGHIGHRGGGGDMEQVNVCSRGGHTGADGVLQHIAGAAGVLTHYDGGTVLPAIVEAQETANLIGVIGGESHTGLTTEAVGS